MSFKENLKSELSYKGMLVKELARKTGISKHTIDNYLNIREITPTLDAAVKIADALEVSVEYLATGNESKNTCIPVNNEVLSLIQNINLLNNRDRNIITELVLLFLKNRKMYDARG